MLQTGHKIGKPAPLFAKLEQQFIDEMKKKYSGPQVTTSSGSGLSVADLEKAVQEQGEKLRQLKSTTKDKAVLQPEIDKLLDLKKQLSEAQAAGENKQNGTSSVKDLEAAVQAQGEKVRQLKAQTKDKSVWQPEVNKLLDLKKQLDAAQSGTSTPATTNPAPASDANQVKELEDKIAKQVQF